MAFCASHGESVVISSQLTSLSDLLTGSAHIVDDGKISIVNAMNKIKIWRRYGRLIIFIYNCFIISFVLIFEHVENIS